MKYSEASQGRCFVIRLEHGDVLHESIEQLAARQGVQAATLVVIGGADRGSRLVVGPEQAQASPVVPMEHLLDNVHEVAGVGTLFPDAKGVPRLHMHVACGRQANTVTGCVRRGVKVWQVMEVILLELVGSSAVRKLHAATGFEMLEP